MIFQNNVFLAVAYKDHETDGKYFPFYEDLADGLKSLGKNLFLPHKRLIHAANTNSVATGLISRSDLILVDQSIPSNVAGSMAAIFTSVGTGVSEKPLIAFYQEGTYGKDDTFFEGFLDVSKAQRVIYNSSEDGLEKITQAVRDFYDS